MICTTRVNRSLPFHWRLKGWRDGGEGGGGGEREGGWIDKTEQMKGGEFKATWWGLLYWTRKSKLIFQTLSAAPTLPHPLWLRDFYWDLNLVFHTFSFNRGRFLITEWNVTWHITFMWLLAFKITDSCEWARARETLRQKHTDRKRICKMTRRSQSARIPVQRTNPPPPPPSLSLSLFFFLFSSFFLFMFTNHNVGNGVSPCQFILSDEPKHTTLTPSAPMQAFRAAFSTPPHHFFDALLSVLNKPPRLCAVKAYLLDLFLHSTLRN